MTVSKPYNDVVDEFSDVFMDELPNELPPMRHVNFSIRLKQDEPPPVKPVIRLSPEELIELKRQLKLLLSKGLIRPSCSPYGAPEFLVHKKEVDLRMVCDYRALNKISTIHDSNPIPLISKTLDQVCEGKIFSKIDLLGAYQQMRIVEEDIPKTAIRTRFGSFEWFVLCFGLTNAPASFTRLLSHLLRELQGECLSNFLDDILVYSSDEKSHKEHLRQLFTVLRGNKLYAKRSKCAIGQQKVEFLGYCVDSEGISTQDRLVRAINEWPVPKNVRHVQQFVGMCNYYRKFIRKYADVMRPITDLLRRKGEFLWSTEQNEAFALIKQKLTNAPVDLTSSY